MSEEKTVNLEIDSAFAAEIVSMVRGQLVSLKNERAALDVRIAILEQRLEALGGEKRVQSSSIAPEPSASTQGEKRIQTADLEKNILRILSSRKSLNAREIIAIAQAPASSVYFALNKLKAWGRVHHEGRWYSITEGGRAVLQ